MAKYDELREILERYGYDVITDRQSYPKIGVMCPYKHTFELHYQTIQKWIKKIIDDEEVSICGECRHEVWIEERPEMLTTFRLKERGWSKSMIKKLLHEPDQTYQNPHFNCAGDAKLYLKDRVEEIEETEEFQTLKDKAKIRSERMKKIHTENMVR